jgi:DNA adenine methylase
MKPLLQPLRWVGGKRQLLPEILARLPQEIETYYEPFAGGAAVFFALARLGRFKRAVLGDTNAELINVYRQLRDDCETVLAELSWHAAHNKEKYFYQQRSRVRGEFDAAGAARFIYINRTCFNGLYRVNKKGEVNTPWGHLAKPRIYDVEGLRVASRMLQGVGLRVCRFDETMGVAGRGDVVYLDPPYLAASKSSNFTAFDKSRFGVAEQEELAKWFRACASEGVHVLLSNSDTIESRRIYGVPGNTVEVVGARRNINSDASKRGAVGEILVSVPVLEVKKKARAA